MGVTIGAVEAVLSARDIMSPTLVDAARAVKSLESQLAALGATSGQAFDNLNERLIAANQHFSELAAINAGAVQQALARTQVSVQQTAANMQMLGTATAATTTQVAAVAPAAAAAATGVSSTSAAAVVGGQSMQSLEGIAQRLIERMLILYAVRGTFQFVVGVYEAADALVKLSESTDLSLGRLQVLQMSADAVGIPFSKVTGAIDTFDKKISENKITTEDALESIGLSFSKIFAMNPEQRWDAVVTAIAAMPDKVQRSKAEIVLFGTDAIDPLVLKSDGLNKTFTDGNKILGDDTLKILAQATQAYKNFWADAKATAAKGFADIVDDASQGPTKMSLGDFKKMQEDALTPPSDRPGDKNNVDIKLPLDNSVWGTGLIQDYIDKLRMAASGEKDLTDEQINQMKELKDLNLLTADNAAQLTKDGVNLDINTAKYRAFLDLEKQREDGIRKQQQATESYNKALFELTTTGDGWKGTLDTIDGVTVESIKWAIQAEVPLRDLAIIYQLNNDQIMAVSKSLQEETANRKMNAAATLEITKLADELNQIVGKEGGTAFQQQTDTIDKWSADLVAKMSKAGTDTNAFYDMLASVVLAKYRQLSVDWKSISDTSTNDTKASLQQVADKAQATFQEALKHIGEFTPEAIQHYRDVADAAQKAADTWGTSVATNAATAANATAASATSQLASINAVTQGYYAQVDAAMAAIAAASGGTISVTGHRPPHLENGIWVDDNGPISTNPTGFKLPGFSLGGATTPGFAKGGIVTVGEFGAERVALPDGAAVYPHGSSGGGGDMNLSISMSVNGVMDPSTVRQWTYEISKEIIKQAKQSLPYGSR